MNIFDKRPLFLIITVMISGFVAFTFSDGIIRGLLFSCAILALILSLIFYYKKKIKKLLYIILPIILLFSMICSYLYFDVHFKLYDQYIDEVEVEGKIISMEDFRAFVHWVSTKFIESVTVRNCPLQSVNRSQRRIAFA